MKIFTDISRSIYDPSYYRELASKNFGYSLRFFVKLMLLATLVTTVLTWGGLAIAYYASDGFDELKRQLIEIYPAELEVTIRGGIISTNQTEPYAIPMPTEWRSEADEIPSVLVVFNTNEDIAFADFQRFDTTVIVGRDTIGVRDSSRNKYTIQSIDDLSHEPLTITHAEYVSALEVMGKAVKGFAVVFLIVILPILYAGFYLVGNAVYLVFGAAVIWVIARVRDWKISYLTAYRFGMHLIVLPTTYLMLTLTIFHGYNIHLLGTLILAIMAILNFKGPLTVQADSRSEDALSVPSADSPDSAKNPDAEPPRPSDS